jgi:hypothetical protein
MPTTIFDSSLITQRNRNKTIANSFISRIQNPSPVNGSAPLLGITEQSLINSVINGQSTYYRKTNNGCTSVNLGCPCAVPIAINTVIDEGILPGPVTNITYEYGSLIISWNAPLIGDIPFTYLVELQATNPVFDTTSNTTYTFENNQLEPGVGYLIAVTPSNSKGSGPTTYYEEGGVPVEVIGIFEAPNITVSSFSVDTCTLGFSFPTSGSGFTITSITTDPVLPSGWSIQSFSNTQIILLNSGSNPASIPGTSFIFSGALGQTTNSSNLVNGIQTAGLNPNYWATNMGANSANDSGVITNDSDGNFYVIGTFSDSTFEVKNYTTVSAGNVITSTYGTLINSGSTDTYLIKYNSLGQVLWATTISGTNNETISSVATYSNTDVFIAGYFNSPIISVNNFVNVDPVTNIVNVTPFGTINNTSSTIGNDTFIIKYTASGQAEWATRIGSLSSGSEEDVSICTDSSGDVYVLGSTNSNTASGISLRNYDGVIGGAVQLPTWGVLSKGNSGFAIFIAKYTGSGVNKGNAQWATLNNNTASSGGPRAYSIIYDSTNTCIYIIARSGNNVAIRSFSSVNPVSPYNITLSNSGTLLLSSLSSFIIKYNLSGGAEYATTITSSSLVNNLTLDTSGNIYVAGYTNITSSFMINDSTGGVTVTPYATLPASASTNTDGYIVKYNSSLQAQWGTTISALDNNGILGITSDGTYIYVIGFFISSAINVNDYDSETDGVITVVPYGSLAKGTSNTNYYIAKYDTDGNAQWTTRLDGITSSTVASAKITTDSSGNVCVTGFYDINPLAISAFSSESGGTINVLPYANLPTIGTRNSFIIKLNSSGQFS